MTICVTKKSDDKNFNINHKYKKKIEEKSCEKRSDKNSLITHETNVIASHHNLYCNTLV